MNDKKIILCKFIVQFLDWFLSTRPHHRIETTDRLNTPWVISYKKFYGKVYNVKVTMTIPQHPNCRCVMIKRHLK